MLGHPVFDRHCIIFVLPWSRQRLWGEFGDPVPAGVQREELEVVRCPQVVVVAQAVDQVGAHVQPLVRLSSFSGQGR